MSIAGDCPECGHHTEELKDGICIDCYCRPNYKTEEKMDEKIFLDIYHHYPASSVCNLEAPVYVAWIRGQGIHRRAKNNEPRRYK